MTPLRKGLVVALVHVALVGAVGAKFWFDRATLPRVWARTVPIDPDLPVRGRYVRLNVAVEHDTSEVSTPDAVRAVRLEARDGALVAIADSTGRHYIRHTRCGDEWCWVLVRPLAFFIPEHVPDPSVRAPGEALWVEVSVPRKGPPRPIRLGVAADGAPQPLALR
ncbi:MAG: hypothetical protein DIU56_014005 [Pseudomonadota bacterium]|jgi:hypothetical protein|nr:MAG: hypothetical protein DIU56_13505 [Pseudomonadota bacterium]